MVAIGVVLLAASMALSVWLTVRAVRDRLSASTPSVTAATTSESTSPGVSSAADGGTTSDSNSGDTLDATDSFQVLDDAYSQLGELDTRVRQFASDDFNHEFFSSDVSVREQLLTEAQSLADESASDKDAFAAQAVSSEYDSQKQTILALYTLLVDRTAALKDAAEVAIDNPSTGTGEGTVKATLVEDRSHENAQQFAQDYAGAKPVAIGSDGGD